MKHLLGPAIAVILSTLGCIYGCHISGMPPREVKFAGILAGSLSSTAAFGAVLLATRPRRIPAATPPTRHR